MSQCRNTSGESIKSLSKKKNKKKKNKFWLIPPKQPFDMTVSRSYIKKSLSALHLEKFRKVRNLKSKK